MTNTNTKILKINDKSLEYAKNLILNEELVAFPTETVYGLGALATSSNAVRKIFEVKGRPQDNPLIVHIHKDFDLKSLVEIENQYVYDLIEKFTPGPLTLVFKSKGVVSPLVSCGLDTLAVRIPSHKGAEEFLKYINLPISAPSANISKHVSPVTAEHVFDDLNTKIDLILDGGKCEGGIESTVLDVSSSTPIILRSGLITKEMIEGVTKTCRYSVNSESEKVKSPGVKYSHYRPKCETALFSRNEIDEAQELYNYYIKQGKKPYFMCDNLISNSLVGEKLLLGENATQIASNLYNCLHMAEKIADILIAIEIDTGSQVDVGIMNRLSKACKKV